MVPITGWGIDPGFKVQSLGFKGLRFKGLGFREVKQDPPRVFSRLCFEGGSLFHVKAGSILGFRV